MTSCPSPPTFLAQDHCLVSSVQYHFLAPWLKAVCQGQGVLSQIVKFCQDLLLPSIEFQKDSLPRVCIRKWTQKHGTCIWCLVWAVVRGNVIVYSSVSSGTSEAARAPMLRVYLHSLLDINSSVFPSFYICISVFMHLHQCWEYILTLFWPIHVYFLLPLFVFLNLLHAERVS